MKVTFCGYYGPVLPKVWQLLLWGLGDDFRSLTKNVPLLNLWVWEVFYFFLNYFIMEISKIYIHLEREWYSPRYSLSSFNSGQHFANLVLADIFFLDFFPVLFYLIFFLEYFCLGRPSCTGLIQAVHQVMHHTVLMLISDSWATNPTPTLFCIHSWATSFLKKIHKNNLMGCAHSISKKAISIVTIKYYFQRRSWISVFVFCSSRVQLLL